MIWLNPTVTKSANCISIMVLKPSSDIPRQAPTIALSQRGVLRTLSFPNSFTNPSVILKAPPYSAMSCPISTRLGCCCMLWCIPSLMASINLRLRSPFDVSRVSSYFTVFPAGTGAYTSFNSSSAFTTSGLLSKPMRSSSSICTFIFSRTWLISSADNIPPAIKKVS